VPGAKDTAEEICSAVFIMDGVEKRMK